MANPCTIHRCPDSVQRGAEVLILEPLWPRCSRRRPVQAVKSSIEVVVADKVLAAPEKSLGVYESWAGHRCRG